MAKRPQGAAGGNAGGNRDSAGVDELDHGTLDAQGNELQREDTEDAPARVAPNLDNDDDDGEELDRVRAQTSNKPPVFDDPRDAIAKAYRARKGVPTEGGEGEDAEEKHPEAAPGEVQIVGRDGKVIATTPEGDDDGEGDAADGEVEIIRRDGTRLTAGVAEAAPAKPAGKKANETAKSYLDDADDSRIVRMKIDNVDVEMTVGEMRNRGQMFIASEKRLKDANALLDRARSTATTASDRTAAPATRDQGDPAPTNRETPRPQSGQPVRPKIDASKLVPVIQKVQLGDDQDAAQAFVDGVVDVVMQTLAENGQTGAVTREQVRREVAVTNAALRQEEGAQGEVSRALELAAGQDADVLGDKRYQGFAFTTAYDLAATALRKIGVPEEDLSLPAQDVFYGYAKLRQDQRYRDKLPALDSVFTTAAGEARKVYELPAPRREERDPPQRQQGNQGQPRVVRTDLDRSGRKGRVSVQPRSASIRSDYSAAGQAPAKSDASSVIAGMAKARGQFAAN